MILSRRQRETDDNLNSFFKPYNFENNRQTDSKFPRPGPIRTRYSC